jgi:hypothetical protein
MSSTGFEWEEQPEACQGTANPRGEDWQPVQSPEELKEESRKIRRLQMVVNMVMQVIWQDPNLTVDEAAAMVADTRRAALADARALPDAIERQGAEIGSQRSDSCLAKRYLIRAGKRRPATCFRCRPGET